MDEDLTQNDAGAVAGGTDSFINVIDRLAQSGAYIVSAVRGGNAQDRSAAPYGQRPAETGMSRGTILALVIGGVVAVIGLVLLLKK